MYIHGKEQDILTAEATSPLFKIISCPVVRSVAITEKGILKSSNNFLPIVLIRNFSISSLETRPLFERTILAKLFHLIFVAINNIFSIDVPDAKIAPINAPTLVPLI